jgi:lipoate-protein ligase A
MDEVIKSINEAPNVFYQGIQWKLWHDKKQREGQLQIDIDNFLLEQYCFNNIPPVIRLWQTNPCLVLSKFDTRYSQFKTTKAVFAENNIPLYIRSTGGTVVPQGPGVLNISLIFSSGEKFTHQYG